MGNYSDWYPDGTVRKTQDDTVWIKMHGTFIPYIWLGTCAKLDEGTDSLGDVTVTHKRNPRGGLSRHSVLKGAPGETTDTLTIKRLQYDRKSTELKRCWWDIDQRSNCGGINADSWNSWEEIIRRCYGSATERGIPSTAFDGDNEEQMFSFGWTSLYSEDLYRVTGEIGSPLALAALFRDITSCQPARCPDGCDDQEGCIVVAVTEDVGGVAYMVVNLSGGDLDQWAAPIALTAFGANDASQVACAGSFVVITSQTANALIRTDDLGANQVEVQTTDMAAHAPIAVDMITQDFVVVGGEDGYIYGSWDTGRTWETLDAGNATASNLGKIMIARDDPQTIYAISNAADVTVKSVNGGKTWFTVAAVGMGGAGLQALCVLDKNHVLILTDFAEIFETSDGGATWTEQLLLPGLTAGAASFWDIVHCGCGVVGLIVNDISGGAPSIFGRFYRNVDNGASGRWYEPTQETMAAGFSLLGLACCGPNHFVAVGGDSAVSDSVLLLE